MLEIPTYCQCSSLSWLFDTTLQVFESPILGAGSWKCQDRWTDALHVLWRAKALLQRIAGDYLCTEKQITHIPSSVIKSHSWLGEIPATTFLTPLERKKPVILLPFIIIQYGINCPGLELSSAQEGQYMNIPCVSRGHFK